MRFVTEIAAGRHRWGLIEGEHADFTHGQSYPLVPFFKLGVTEPDTLRLVPFLVGLAGELALLAAVAAGRGHLAARACLLLGLSTLFLQPGMLHWLGALHPNSFQSALAFGALAAAAALGRRFRPAAFGLGFVSAWFQYEFLIAALLCVFALRWLLRDRDAASSAAAATEAGLDTLAYAAGMALTFTLHSLRVGLYHGSAVVALRMLAGAAAARAGFSGGAELDPEYYRFIEAATLAVGDPGRLDVARRYFQAFFARGFGDPLQICAVVAVAAGAPAIAARRGSARVLGRLTARSLGILAVAAVSAFAWPMLFPRHVAHHLHTMPRLLFLPLATLLLAGGLLAPPSGDTDDHHRARRAGP